MILPDFRLVLLFFDFNSILNNKYIFTRKIIQVHS
jgi:hypothetical protein